MGVVSFQRKKKYELRTQDLPETVGWVAGVVFSILGLPVYCLFTGQFYLCFLLTCCDCLGAIIGYVKFKRIPNRCVSCVPWVRARKDRVMLKLAA